MKYATYHLTHEQIFGVFLPLFNHNFLPSVENTPLWYMFLKRSHPLRTVIHSSECASSMDPHTSRCTCQSSKCEGPLDMIWFSSRTHHCLFIKMWKKPQNKAYVHLAWGLLTSCRRQNSICYIWDHLVGLLNKCIPQSKGKRPSKLPIQLWHRDHPRIPKELHHKNRKMWQQHLTLVVLQCC